MSDLQDVVYIIHKQPKCSAGTWSKCRIIARRRIDAKLEDIEFHDSFIWAREEALWGIRMEQCDIWSLCESGISLDQKTIRRLSDLKDRWHLVRNAIDPTEQFLFAYPQLPSWMQFIIRWKQRVRKAWRKIYNA